MQNQLYFAENLALSHILLVAMGKYVQANGKEIMIRKMSILTAVL